MPAPTRRPARLGDRRQPLPLDARPGRRSGRRRRAAQHRSAARAADRKEPGRRVPRTVDAAEFAVRAVLGQQVSTAAARTHAPRGSSPHTASRSTIRQGGLTHLFPDAVALAELDPEKLAMPKSRRKTLTAWCAHSPMANSTWASAATGTGPGPARRAARIRAVDRGDDRDARAWRPGRLRAERPRHPPRRARSRPAGEPRGADPPRRRLAAVAGLRRAVPLGNRRTCDQPVAGRSGLTSVADGSARWARPA